MRFMTDLKYQIELLRPLPYVIVNGDQWKFPILTSYQDVLKQDEDYQNPEGQPSGSDRYGLAPTATATGPATAAAPKDPIEAELDEIKAVIDRARKERVLELAIQAFNEALDVSNRPSISATHKQRAVKLKDEANQLESELKREKVLGPAKPTPTGPGTPTTVVARPRQPIQQVWAHDAAEGSLKDGNAYQFRIRCQILNTLAGDAAKFDNPEHAAAVVLASPWSAPTEPITFEPSSLFFVTYEDRSKKVVGLEFFRWYDGVWLKSRRENLEVGSPITAQQQIEVPGITDPTVAERASVDFSGGGTVVDIDFGRDMLERKITRGSEGVSFGPPKKETAMVYMDSEGRLHERFVPMDKEHPEKRNASARVWIPKAKP
jgi:hypothetical protein